MYYDDDIDSLSFKSSIGTSRYTTISPQIASQLNSIHEVVSQSRKMDLGITEINVKTMSDNWICAKRKSARQVYSVSLMKPDLTLADAQLDFNAIF